MNKYHIRFNHQHNGSGKVWRVFENGTEYLVEHLDIQVPTRDDVTVENGVEKWSSIDSSLTPDDNSSLLFNDDGDITINNSNSTWSLSREKCLQNMDCKNSYFNKNNGPYKLKFESNELNLYDKNNNVGYF